MDRGADDTADSFEKKNENQEHAAKKENPAIEAELESISTESGEISNQSSDDQNKTDQKTEEKNDSLKRTLSSSSSSSSSSSYSITSSVDSFGRQRRIRRSPLPSCSFNANSSYSYSTNIGSKEKTEVRREADYEASGFSSLDELLEKYADTQQPDRKVKPLLVRTPVDVTRSRHHRKDCKRYKNPIESKESDNDYDQELKDYRERLKRAKREYRQLCREEQRKAGMHKKCAETVVKGHDPAEQTEPEFDLSSLSSSEDEDIVEREKQRQERKNRWRLRVYKKSE